MNKASFQKQLSYQFNSVHLLENALTHSSYTYENNLFKSNERLEFLGDAILDAVISEFLFLKLPHYEEGQLSKLRSYVVCEKTLANCGRKIKIDKELYLGRGEETSGGRERDSIVADAVEALIGAIFLDGGYESAKSFILKHFEDVIHEAKGEYINSDYKSRLQEILQKGGKIDISYEIEKEEGPEHRKTFFVNLNIDHAIKGKGQGRTKKEAEQQAAKSALKGIQGGTENVF